MASVKENHRQWLRDFYKKSSDIITICSYTAVFGLSGTTKSGYYSEVYSTGQIDKDIISAKYWKNAKKIIGDSWNMFGIKPDGRVLISGRNRGGVMETSYLDVSGWTDIVDVVKAEYVTAGLRKDGTVIATGINYYGESNVYGFRSIKQIVAGKGFVAGLRTDGKVEFAGVDRRWQENNQNNKGSLHDITKIKHYYDVSSWTDIIRLYAISEDTLVGLRSDGRVFVTGNPYGNFSELTSWTDIVDIIGNKNQRVVGIKRDGSAVFRSYEQKQISDNHISIESNQIVSSLDVSYLLLLKSDGTVVVGDTKDNRIQAVSSWKNIVAIYRVNDIIIGLKSNGEVLQTSYDPVKDHDTTKWLEDSNHGIDKPYDDYEFEYTVDTRGWKLQSVDLDAYILAVRMMLEGDDETPCDLLKTIDYFYNTTELIKCLEKISDKKAIYACVLACAKHLHDQFELDNENQFKANWLNFNKVCELLTLISDYDEARDYLAQIKAEREKCYEMHSQSSKQTSWENKSADDFYTAAISGDINAVREIISHQKNIINERYHVQKEDGSQTSFSVVFSILSKMNEIGLNYEVMDAISAAGVNYNQNVEVQNIGNDVLKHSIQPLLFYTIKMWNNLELTRYLLEHGADPDAVVIDNAENEYYLDSRLTMLSYAIRFCEDSQMLQLLLLYGANPQKCCHTICTDRHNVTQELPPLFYSVVTKSSLPKTAWLLHFGASTNDIIDVGAGFKHRNSFMGYIRLNHPQKIVGIDRAYNMSRYFPAPKVKYVYLSMYGQRPTGNAVYSQGINSQLPYVPAPQPPVFASQPPAPMPQPTAPMPQPTAPMPQPTAPQSSAPMPQPPAASSNTIAPQSMSSSDQDIIGKIKTRIQKFLDSDTGKKIKQKCSDIKTGTQKLYNTATEKLKAMIKK